MRVVLIDRESDKPLTVVDLPVGPSNLLTSGRVVEFAMLSTSKRYIDDPAVIRPQTIDRIALQGEIVKKGTTGAPMFWFATGADPFTVEVLRAAFLPGYMPPGAAAEARERVLRALGARA